MWDFPRSKEVFIISTAKKKDLYTEHAALPQHKDKDTAVGLASGAVDRLLCYDKLAESVCSSVHLQRSAAAAQPVPKGQQPGSGHQPPCARLGGGTAA